MPKFTKNIYIKLTKDAKYPKYTKYEIYSKHAKCLKYKKYTNQLIFLQNQAIKQNNS